MKTSNDYKFDSHALPPFSDYILKITNRLHPIADNYRQFVFGLTRPFFLPLKKEYYLKFKSGEQDCEIRPCNHHSWNPKNIYAGRVVTLSLGYGKQDRTEKMIRNTIITDDLYKHNIPKWHIDAVHEIYGERPFWLVAYV